MSIWVVKCSNNRKDGTGWHWTNYFEGADANEPFLFGSDNDYDWIKHRGSIKRIRDEIARGDLVVCYQTNRREILGLTRLHSGGKHGESGLFNVFNLEPASQAFVFNTPIQVVEDLYDHGIYPDCFGKGTMGTLYEVTAKEFAEMVDAIQQKLPEQQRALKAWLARNGW
ncbi:MAG: hypothetical protein HY268_25115 [Deltaproteobacteria bacterium]|nr:hypothetical protein [Deltaproteobacteria bacterium]